MEIFFYKMQGCGNDFIVFDNRNYRFSPEALSRLAMQICKVHISVGSDALMVVDEPQSTGDFRMLFFNADGTQAEMCGNGARCLARFAYEEGIAAKSMIIETKAGLVPAWREDQRTYRVRLNEPSEYRQNLPLLTTGLEKVVATMAESITFIDYVELGNPGIPHLVVGYPELEETDLAQLAPLAKALRHWSALPKGANVNFVSTTKVAQKDLPAVEKKSTDSGENDSAIAANAVNTASQIMVRTYERGVEDFTLACGTGSGSVAYSLVQRGLIASDTPVVIDVLGGQLVVAVNGKQLDLIGPTNIVVKGILVDEDLDL